MTDADGNRYIDYVLSWGPLMLGTARRKWLRRDRSGAKGTSFGASTPLKPTLRSR